VPTNAILVARIVSKVGRYGHEGGKHLAATVWLDFGWIGCPQVIMSRTVNLKVVFWLLWTTTHNNIRGLGGLLVVRQEDRETRDIFY
jgi:hypothetical protein